MPATAVPFCVAYFTVTVFVLAVERLTTRVAFVLPEAGLVTVALVMASVGVDVGADTASMIVAVALDVERVALTGLFRFNRKVLLASPAVVIAATGTETVWEVWPAVKVNVPDVAV